MTSAEPAEALARADETAERRIRRRSGLAAHDAVARAARRELRSAGAACAMLGSSRLTRFATSRASTPRARAARGVAGLSARLGGRAAAPRTTAAALHGTAPARTSAVEIELEPVEQDAPGLAGVTRQRGARTARSRSTGRGADCVPARSEGRRARMAGDGRIPRRGRDPRRGRSPGAAARPHVRPGAGGGAGAVRVTVEIEVVEDPARACARDARRRRARGRPRRPHRRIDPARGLRGVRRAPSRASAWISATRPIWFGDERCVPPDDERANSRMIEESLLGPLAGVTQPTFKRIKGELGPDEGADDYERELTAAGPPRFDLAAAGAWSRRPHGLAVPRSAARSPIARGWWSASRCRGWSRSCRGSRSRSRRSRARDGWSFWSSGASKAEAVAAAFGPGTRPDPHVPSSSLPEVAQELLVLTDPAAAGRL